ncbi:MAG TPA: hypothetical protein VH351_05235 [Bryobacteraceae bacterium]|jgi:hypothetical protein|nr:hypothetical protein [Bryobacteraceae bacterium]
MDLRFCLRTVGCAFATLCFCEGVSAQAAIISATYTLNAPESDRGDALVFTGSGSVDPLGSMAWSEREFNFVSTISSNGDSIVAFDGTFAMTFANGTLFGSLHGTAESFVVGIFSLDEGQKVTGGTGAFVGYNGTLTGTGVAEGGGEQLSGFGTLNTTPEPAPVALLAIGFLCLAAYRMRSAVPSASRTWRCNVNNLCPTLRWGIAPRVVPARLMPACRHTPAE